MLPHESDRSQKPLFKTIETGHSNSELKKEENYTCDLSKSGFERSPGALGHGPYGERPTNCTNYIDHLLSS
jgi:hypothetical protein